MLDPDPSKTNNDPKPWLCQKKEDCGSKIMNLDLDPEALFRN